MHQQKNIKETQPFCSLTLTKALTEKRLLYKLAIKCIAVLHILNDGR